MRILSLCVALTVFCPLLGAGQERPIPVGLRKVEKLPYPADGTPSQLRPLPAWRRADPTRLEREADELAKLAQLVPPEVAQVKTGRLPQDLNERLKRIEKLSKRLRRELSP